MRDAYIIGTHSTQFKKWPEKDYKTLTREAYEGALADAGLANGDRIGLAWFGNCGMWAHGQGSIRGQVCFTPLVREGRFPERVPMINVEGACATGAMTLNGACKDIRAGDTEISLAIAVEKLFDPDSPETTKAMFDAGVDQFDPEDWHEYYRAAGEKAGSPFEPGPGRTIFMDTYAMQACHHMNKHGSTQRQFAVGAAKNHCNGAKNEKAQYRFEMTVDEVMEDRLVSFPLTRSMCAPIGDGAAAAIVCSADALAEMPPDVQSRAVRVAATALSGGKYRDLDEPGLSKVAADTAYAAAGITPADIDVAEVHDATAFCEIYQAEMMGFCDIGEGGRFVESGATMIGGKIPINTSGGLVSKGHPVGATGLSMIYELVTQLRGDAGERQVKGAEFALAENGGGVMGFDEAACSVTILHKDR